MTKTRIVGQDTDLTAADIEFTPDGSIAATDVQAAIVEVRDEATGGGSLTVEDEGTPLATSATTLDFVGAGVTATGAGAEKTITIPGGGSADDPIADIFGAADTAFEFDTISLTGLTAMGTPDTADADTTVPGAYYIKDNATGTAWCGHYAASPATPFTAIAQILDTTARQNYNGAGLYVGVGTPGKFQSCEFGAALRQFGVNIYTSPTVYASTPVAAAWPSYKQSFYIGVVAASNTSLTWYISLNGRTWWALSTALDPALTIGSVGIGQNSDNTAGLATAFGFLRIWNSSKTFV